MIIILWKNSGMQKQHNRHSNSLCWRQIYLHIWIWWSYPNNVNVVCGKTMIIIAFISYMFWVQLLHSRTLTALWIYLTLLLNAYGSWQCDVALLCVLMEISNCPHIFREGTKTKVTCKQIPYHTYSEYDIHKFLLCSKKRISKEKFFYMSRAKKEG